MKIANRGTFKNMPNCDHGGVVFPVGSGDCCTPYAVCEDRFKIAKNASVSTVKIKNMKGEVQTIAFPAVSGAEAVRAAVANAVGGIEHNVFVSTSDAGTDFLLAHQGNAEVLQIGSVSATARQCTIQFRCDFKLDYAGGTGDVFSANGNTTALGALVFGTQSAADVKAEISAAVPSTALVSVSEDASNAQFKIVINDLSSADYSLKGTTFVKCNCEEVFKP
jgi:hypothetical protein